MQSDQSGNRTMSPAEWALLIFLSVVWGGSFFFNAVGVAALPPLTVVLVRVAVAAVTLWIVMALLGRRMPRERAVWRAFLLMGLLNNAIPFALIVWGQSHIASGLAAILNAATPVFTVLVAHFATTDERMTPARAAGVLTGLAGVAVLVGGAGGTVGHVPAMLACLAAALSYALAGVYGRRFARIGVSPMATATGQVTASSALLLLLVLLVDRPWTLAMPDGWVIASLLALGTASTALAYIVYFRLLASAGATNLLLVTLLVPVTAVLLGTAFLGETLQLRHFAGMALIAAGLAFIDGRLPRFLRSRLSSAG